MLYKYADTIEISKAAKALFAEERQIKRLDGWFLIRESYMKNYEALKELPEACRAAEQLNRAVGTLPLSISKNAIFAGTQRDAFARSYALINPSFRVETFSGYCDPTAVYGDIEPDEEFTAERIAGVKAFDRSSDYVKELSAVYSEVEPYTSEVIFFIEQVTGHIIPDMRNLLANGVAGAYAEISDRLKDQKLNLRQINEYKAMKTTLDTVLSLASRYRSIAEAQLEKAASESEKERLSVIVNTLSRVPLHGAVNLYEAIQSFMLLWQVMCLEQAPNPFAFSVGNADRIFEPYRNKGNYTQEEAAALFKHLLVFFNVADRSWAISQNIILSGKNTGGDDLTNPTTYALLDAYYDMNLPQPILSVKLHKNTPEKLYKSLGRFFFTPGCLTPSLFNDDSLFEILKLSGIDENDLPDYSVAGCQEPLIMGKENGNTTNSWLNLAKILEITLSGGVSAVTGKTLDDSIAYTCDSGELLKDIRGSFYSNLKKYVHKMAEAANGAAKALSHLPVPFLSMLMGGIETGYDMRDCTRQGTKYNGSGCLIHGLSVVSDSFIAIDHLITEKPKLSDELLAALRDNFEGHEALHAYLKQCPKFGSNDEATNREAARLAKQVSELLRCEKNYLGNPFKPDFSTPSTHLLYGYWVGALPDGRRSGEMLNYGADPLAGDAHEGMGFRVLSEQKLPYELMCGGCASHLGIDPKYFKAKNHEDKGIEFKQRIITPLFFNNSENQIAPFYLYVNVTTPEMLRRVRENPGIYAPTGIYIMRIHGTFVNFLDLSPAIQDDIIKRLDPCSASIL